MTAVGIVANPASGRDIRRLVSGASVFPVAEKANLVQRMLTALGAVGVETVLVSVDLGGISAAVLRAVRNRSAKKTPWPHVQFVDDDAITESAQDTANAVRRMVEAGAKVIICLGGDGTARVATAALLASSGNDVPLLSLSTGTNNAFPQLREATVAGLAAGLVATGAVDHGIATTRAHVLEVRTGERTELGLVDVAVSTAPYVGSRALWHPDALTELYCSFAEPDATGLSSIAGLLCPSPRDKPEGVAVRLCPAEQAPTVVNAPIAPGLVLPVGVADWRPLRTGEQVEISTARGVVAFDGERELELAGTTGATVRLREDGPLCVDVTAVMSQAARAGLFRSDRTAV
ncbi:ATP-NAD kinase family protein [Streptomyces sp. NPDC052013]|uniref:ATP-NAD kinase family protein n=1 Tax=Streptomyces sp. NPDC052013 TaxID=3365679 RepID=UPI0037D627CC